MAEALLGVAFENLVSLIQNEFSTISGIKSKALKLSTTLDLIKAVLEDAEQKQITDRSIKVWLQQLKDAVYVLDDILDECSIQSSQFKGSFSFTLKNIIFRHNIGTRFKEITKRFDDIAESKNKFLLQERVIVRERSIEVAEWRQTSSVIAEPKVFGREDDKEKIVEFLLTQAKGSDLLSIYPIVGLGGIGKTTLAQLVYNDVRVSDNFDTKIWVCVSDAFSVNKILCSIIESFKREKCDALDLDVIQAEVQELLQGKRYLLVLDDVWNRNQELEFGLSQEKWKKLKSVLLCGSKGSSILVSTRDRDVAEIMGTCQAHHLSGLSEHECWLLFKQYAFGHDREQKTEFVTVGKEIVKKCGGLPLAAQALGGLMRSRIGEKEWLEIKHSRLWSLPNENSIMPALRLSYFHLTPTLKQCFTFCAMFPKDTEILKDDLIHLWIANGFISSRENLEIEDVGNMIWNELCQKSFFQDIKMVNDSGDISFKLHDLVHDLAQSIIGTECLILENTNITDLSTSTHHIGLVSATPSLFDKGAFTRVESLRTLFQIGFYNTRFSDCFPTSVRVLRTNSFDLSSLRSLIHLRYLELFDFHDIKTLPDSIYSLRNLEILKLEHFSKLRCLPENLNCLQKLRHLVIENCDALSRVFPNIGKLSSLRTLSKHIVRLEIGYSLAELHDLQLGGKLSITCLENVGSLSEAREANLIDKKELQEICMSWNNRRKTKSPATSTEEVLEVLEPHSNLKILKIHGYDGLYLPNWIQIKSSLVVLRLSYCKNCVRLPSLGKLPSLKKLQLWYMDNVQYVDDEESSDGVEVRGFPSLEELLLGNLPNLERLLKVETGEVFPRLSKLAIVGCPKLGLPCLSSLKELIVDGCNYELLGSISSFYGLTILEINRGEDVTSFPKGMLRNLTYLRTLEISDFPKLKALSNEPFNLALEHLGIHHCRELESLPEEIWEGLRSLRTMEIAFCEGLRCLPEGIRHLTSLEVLTIYGCPAVAERCKEGIGEDWDKVEHIPKLSIS